MTEQETQQAETVAEIRARFGMAYECGDSDTLAEFVAEMLKITDSKDQKIEAMQKQLNAYSLITEAAGSLMQKQYTEEELQAEFESSHSISYCIRALDGGYASERTAIDWKGWLDCARFLGAIKEQEK